MTYGANCRPAGTPPGGQLFWAATSQHPTELPESWPPDIPWSSCGGEELVRVAHGHHIADQSCGVPDPRASGDHTAVQVHESALEVEQVHVLQAGVLVGRRLARFEMVSPDSHVFHAWCKMYASFLRSLHATLLIAATCALARLRAACLASSLCSRAGDGR